MKLIQCSWHDEGERCLKTEDHNGDCTFNLTRAQAQRWKRRAEYGLLPWQQVEWVKARPSC